MSDFTVQNEGNIFLLHTNNAEADMYVAAHFMTEDESGPQFFGRAVVVEHRYIASIVKVLREEGFHVS